MQQAEAKGTLLNLSFTLWLIDSRVKAIINHWKIGLLDPSTDLDFCPFNERGVLFFARKKYFYGGKYLSTELQYPKPLSIYLNDANHEKYQSVVTKSHKGVENIENIAVLYRRFSATCLKTP